MTVPEPPTVAGNVSVAAVWPASTFGTAVGADAVASAELTVIVLDKELKVTGVLALSIAITLNV